ncbi:unnamed protein product [Thlaspi arvense]|uniref:ATPase AAA-type core domain-containing protein n=1 Tax=Thlaspi arvense TaxID=13288 RepID=A0AAU9SRJ2_THLAR|nr:unnamed protein product [Thlaspi arvense]
MRAANKSIMVVHVDFVTYLVITICVNASILAKADWQIYKLVVILILENISRSTLTVQNMSSAIFQHHTTFEILAMEPEFKNTMIHDLDDFSNGKDFFKAVGRAWKRGYLLYGPPKTGKSSLVAAIANHMNYSIYIIFRFRALLVMRCLDRFLLQLRTARYFSLKILIAVERIVLVVTKTKMKEKMTRIRTRTRRKRR